MRKLRLGALRFVTLLLLLGSIVLAPKAANAANEVLQPTISVLYCLENTQGMTLEQAKQCSYVPYADSPLPARYAAQRWVKVQASTAPDWPILSISVVPHLLREIEIFDGNTGEVIAGPVGTEHPYSSEHGLMAGYVFTIRPTAAGVATYYIRMVTYGIPYAFVEVSNEPPTAQTIHQQIGLGIHLGVLGLLTLVSLCVYVATRSTIMGVFGLNILNLFLSTLLGSGFLYAHIWPEMPKLNEMLFNAMFYVKPALWVLLAQTFLRPYQTPAWYRPSCMIVYGLVATMLVLSWLDLSEISLLLMLIFGATVIPIVQVLAIHRTTGLNRFYQRVLMLGYTWGAIVVWLALAITLSPTDNPHLPILLTRIIDYVNPVVLLALVLFHYRETSRQLAAAEEENLKMRLGLEFSKKLREERKLLVDMLTHELKNPLTSISLAIGSLSRAMSDSGEQNKRRLLNIAQCVRGMDAVIERCNLMNQLDQSTLNVAPETIRISEVLSSILLAFPDARRVSLSLKGRDDFVTDPQFFKIIVTNLIDNALKYSATGSEVGVSICREINRLQAGDGEVLVVRVTNQMGTKGRPDPALIFERFYRHPLAHNTSGSGIGLYLAQTITNLMGGKINCLTTDTDVVFEVILPENMKDA